MPKGCDSVMRAKLGKRYAEKKAYTVLLRNGFADIWALREWHSACLAFNGSNNLLEVYLDGSLKTAEVITGDTFPPLSNTSLLWGLVLFQVAFTRN